MVNLNSVNTPTAMSNSKYWNNRQDAIYLFAAKRICEKFAPKPLSVIDVGSNGTPILEWFRDSAQILVSLDLRNPYVADGVESFTMDILDYSPTKVFDLATCFQVVEHVPDPEPFVQKLILLSRITVISVPYKWPNGACKYHIHDPVTSRQLESWAGQKPKYKYVARELNQKERLVHVYDNFTD